MPRTRRSIRDRESAASKHESAAPVESQNYRERDDHDQRDEHDQRGELYTPYPRVTGADPQTPFVIPGVEETINEALQEAESNAIEAASQSQDSQSQSQPETPIGDEVHARALDAPGLSGKKLNPDVAKIAATLTLGVILYGSSAVLPSEIVDPIIATLSVTTSSLIGSLGNIAGICSGLTTSAVEFSGVVIRQLLPIIIRTISETSGSVVSLAYNAAKVGVAVSALGGAVNGVVSSAVNAINTFKIGSNCARVATAQSAVGVQMQRLNVAEEHAKRVDSEEVSLMHEPSLGDISENLGNAFMKIYEWVLEKYQTNSGDEVDRALAAVQGSSSSASQGGRKSRRYRKKGKGHKTRKHHKKAHKAHKKAHKKAKHATRKGRKGHKARKAKKTRSSPKRVARRGRR